MNDFNVNKKVAELLNLMQNTTEVSDTFKMLEFHGKVRKILSDCYNRGISDSFDNGNKPKITKLK